MGWLADCGVVCHPQRHHQRAQVRRAPHVHPHRLLSAPAALSLGPRVPAHGPAAALCPSPTSARAGSPRPRRAPPPYAGGACSLRLSLPAAGMKQRGLAARLGCDVRLRPARTPSRAARRLGRLFDCRAALHGGGHEARHPWVTRSWAGPGRPGPTFRCGLSAGRRRAKLCPQMSWVWHSWRLKKSLLQSPGSAGEIKRQKCTMQRPPLNQHGTEDASSPVAARLPFDATQPLSFPAARSAAS